MARKKAQAKKTQAAAKTEVEQAATVVPQELVEPTAVQPELTPDSASEQSVVSIKAETHANARAAQPRYRQKRWVRIAGLAMGAVALVAIIAAGILGQFYKTRIMPGVYVAGVQGGEKKISQVEETLKSQLTKHTVTFTSGEKKLTPTPEEIGYQVDVKKTLLAAKDAKRSGSFIDRLTFWKRVDIPAVITVNDTLLGQYLETNLPEISKAPVDAQLQFNASEGSFAITEQADGQGADIVRIKQALVDGGYQLNVTQLAVKTASKKPGITKEKLAPLLEPANGLVSQRVVLTGLGFTFQARPADIATWLTPTPQEDGTVSLVIDEAKIQSYVEGISKRISSAPVDRKVVKDQATGAEVVIQQGRDGTELADKQQLAAAIATALKNKSGTTQTMNIQTAAFNTVNMEAFEKWIEVDLSEQRTTAYERAAPVKNFIIASGTRGHETVTGEFSIWLKVRKQTMQGGSKADGSYYSIPNVEWVSYFYKDYALHGAWWREKFGAPASHGCVNMTNADAQWVYEWAPVGTKVIVHQ